jgi:hypothetical protein
MLPSGYLDSRSQFIDLARRLHAHIESVPCPDNDRSSLELTVDTAYLGDPYAPVLVVIASGTHGVEGYAGAACQLHFMKNFSRYADRSDIGFLLAHAVNPWGYYHNRRVTHEGVDLNRNFVIDFTSVPAHCGYSSFHAPLVADYKPLPAGWWNEVRLLSSAISKKKRQELQAAITAGQYQYPDGLFYGGAAATQARRIWEGVLDAHFAHRSCVALLDVHTGLGKPGTAELISYLPEDSQDFQKMARWFNGTLCSMQSGSSVTSPVSGTLTEGFDRTASMQSYAIGLEFGTCSPIRILNTLRYDTWAHQQSGSDASQLRERARHKMKRAFCLDHPEWHSQITARFEETMDQLVAGVSRYAKTF